MSTMDSGIGDAVEVITGCGVRAEGRWALVPAWVSEGFIGSRGAVHRISVWPVSTGRRALFWVQVLSVESKS